MRNLIVLTVSTLVYFLIFFVGIGDWVGGKSLPLSLLIFSVVIPLIFGYVTYKYLKGNSVWTPAITVVIPIIPNAVMLIYGQIQTGWGPMDVPLSATVGFIVLQTIFVALGAYACYQKYGFK